MKISFQQGWSSLELVMLLPLIVGLIGLIFYAGQVGFTRLHLISVVDAAARVAAVKGCLEGEQLVKNSLNNSSNILINKCSPGNEVSINVTYKVETSIPFFELLQTEVSAQAHALNEKN